MAPLEGFLNLLKPPGMTSHDAVAGVRRILGIRSVGHAGTLDPAAAGVLPLAVGKATRLLEYLLAANKSYVGEATFGLQTDTLDQEGEIALRRPAVFCLTELERQMAAFIGPGQQVPPAYAAIKHRGKPLYAYARQGEVIAAPSREIVVERFQLLAYSPGQHPRCLFRVDCSKGTYVRALVRDLAVRLQTVATLTFLLRTKAGDFEVDNAISLEELQASRDAGRLVECLLPSDAVVRHLPAFALSSADAERFVNGQAVPVDNGSQGLARAYLQDRLLGIAHCLDHRLLPRKVLTSREELVK